MHLPRLSVKTLSAMSDSFIAEVIDAMNEFGCARITQTGRPAGPTESLSPLGRLFGAPIHHKLSDRHGVHPIRYIPGYPEYANAVNGDLLLHTDASFEPNPPAVMLMYSETPSPEGGLSTLASGDELYAHIADVAPEALPGLSRPDAFRIRRDDREASRAVLENRGDRWRLAFRYADNLPIRVHPDAETGYAMVRKWLMDPANAIAFRLEPGEVLIFDNARMLHGRTAFPKDAGRSLHGLWCDGVGGDPRLNYGIPKDLDGDGPALSRPGGRQAPRRAASALSSRSSSSAR